MPPMARLIPSLRRYILPTNILAYAAVSGHCTDCAFAFATLPINHVFHHSTFLVQASL
jgi:hypothetical protein